jgi:hypothetical protein
MKVQLIIPSILSLVFKVSDKPTTKLPIGYVQKLSTLTQSVPSLDYQLYISSSPNVQIDHYIHYNDFQNLEYLSTDDPASVTTGDVVVISTLDKRQVAVDCPTQDQCITTTRNCSSHGSCTLQPHPRKPQTNCFYCSCSLNRFTNDQGQVLDSYPGFVRWSGHSCEAQDISIEFHIVFWTSLALFLALMYSFCNLVCL